MDKIKNKYEIILGFVTLVISLSAFKEELSKVTLELGYTTVSLADYFLWVVYGFSICLYLYVTENIARDTVIGKWKIFDYFLKVAYFLFAFILLTPFLVIINIIAFKIYFSISKNYDEAKNFFPILVNIGSALIGSVVSLLASTRFLKDRKRKAQEEIEEQEIKDLDNATKLLSDGYFSHSVLESFKVLETHLYKKLILKDIRVSKHRLNEIIQIALKEKIITDNDLPSIQDIRGMRNIAAHSDTKYTKEQAEFALNFVKELLKRKDE